MPTLPKCEHISTIAAVAQESQIFSHDASQTFSLVRSSDHLLEKLPLSGKGILLIARKPCRVHVNTGGNLEVAKANLRSMQSAPSQSRILGVEIILNTSTSNANSLELASQN